jgi:hypothetical protein
MNLKSKMLGLAAAAALISTSIHAMRLPYEPNPELKVEDLTRALKQASGAIIVPERPATSLANFIIEMSFPREAIVKALTYLRDDYQYTDQLSERIYEAAKQQKKLLQAKFKGGYINARAPEWIQPVDSQVNNKSEFLSNLSRLKKNGSFIPERIKKQFEHLSTLQTWLQKFEVRWDSFWKFVSSSINHNSYTDARFLNPVPSANFDKNSFKQIVALLDNIKKILDQLPKQLKNSLQESLEFKRYNVLVDTIKDEQGL